MAAKKPLPRNGVGALRGIVCVFPTLEAHLGAPLGCAVMTGELFLPLAAVLALLSIAGCAQYYGKGKAPPPVVTKG